MKVCTKPDYLVANISNIKPLLFLILCGTLYWPMVYNIGILMVHKCYPKKYRSIN